MPAIRELDRSEYPRLAESIGERVETVITCDALRSAACRAWVAGDIDHFDAALTDSRMLPGEPIAFGTDAAAVVAILQHTPTWNCVEADPPLARRIGAEMSRQWGGAVKYHGDIYYELPNPPPVITDDRVRLARESDLSL